jgi:hypothetical protein
MEMENQDRLQDRRNAIRFNLIYPAIYVRFDSEGRPFDEKPSNSVNISLGGVRLGSRGNGGSCNSLQGSGL